MKAAQRQVRALLRTHQDRVRTLRDTVSPKFVVNREIDEAIQTGGVLIEMLFGGDNPGAKELLLGEYLSGRGSAGRIARQLMGAALGCQDSFGTHVLALNKSSFHTPRTNGLTALLRPGGCAPHLRQAILDDQAENGRLMARLAALLKVPVVTVGTESNRGTFHAFREALDAEIKALGPIVATFRGTGLPHAFRKVPHFSMSKIFCRNSDQEWNAGLDRFVARWKPTHPGLLTDKMNVSSKYVLESTDRAMQVDFLRSVILGAQLEQIPELAQKKEGAGEVEKAQEVLRFALVADDEATEAVEPGEETLHLPAPLVAP